MEIRDKQIKQHIQTEITDKQSGRSDGRADSIYLADSPRFIKAKIFIDEPAVYSDSKMYTCAQKYRFCV